MKKLLLFSLLATAMLFAACGDNNGEATPETPGKAGAHIEGSIILMFYEPETLDVDFLSPSQGYDNVLLWIYAISSSESAKMTENHWYKSSEKGQEYVKYYGDTTFSGWISYSRDGYKVSAMPLNSINIVSDKDFDSEHPAGSSLNDIFNWEYASAWNLIQSNYDPEINILQWGKYQKMPLSEFKPINLMQYDTYFYFNKLPEKLGTYEFTITFDYGKDPISGREAKVAPAVVKAEFTEKDYVALPKR